MFTSVFVLSQNVFWNFYLTIFQGKSLYIQRRREEARAKFADVLFWHSTVIRFLEKSINVDDVIDSLHEFESRDDKVLHGEPHFVHLDITPSVSINTLY